MAIDIGEARSRNVVAWLNTTPPAEAQKIFEAREYGVVKCNDSDLADLSYLSGVAAVVFTQSAEKATKVLREIDRHWRKLLDNDCRVIVRPADNDQHSKIIEARIGVNKRPVSFLPRRVAGVVPAHAEDKLWYPKIDFASLNTAWHDVANIVDAHPPDHAPSRSLVIEGEAHIREGREILFRRAFWNCSHVDVGYMTELGRSGASVYRVHVSRSATSAWSLPCFVKVGKRHRIIDEYNNYVEHLGPEIPFHLGPQLRVERCCLGGCEALLVGDYVDGSETLLRCAYDGRAGPAIACLFDRTLQGWHRTGEKVQPLGATGAIEVPSSISPHRLQRARYLGASCELNDLRTLLKACGDMEVRCGRIHGDLHARNILVRGSDAVVIDLGASRDGALLHDPASLEASLLVEGFARARRPVDEWLPGVQALYENVDLSRRIPTIGPMNPAAWFYSCVRQIRLYARQMEREPRQYAAVLASCLLWKARKDKRLAGRAGELRAAAFLLAEKVLTTTSAGAAET